MEFGVVLQWVLALGVLSAIGAPLAAAAFPRFPGRGAAFALPAALLPVALVAFWIGQVRYGYWPVVLSVALVAGLSLLARRRGARPDWRAVGRAFGVFLLGFAVLLAFRAFEPTVTQYAGEQFLHFGLLQSLERAGQLPPEDLWYAGEPLRYYYGTQLQVTLLSQFAGVPVRYGFNLGIATFYGILFAAAYGLAGAIAAWRGYPRRLGGALGVAFVAVGGATTTAVRYVLGQFPGDVAAGPTRAAFGYAASRFGTPLAEFVAQQSDPATWSWWYTRYVVPGTLQEFPLYSFVKADLHGHALSTGYVVLAAAVAVAYYRTPAERRWRRRGLLLCGLGLLSGVFGFMNTWSLPTAVGLATLAVAGADAHPASLLPAGLAARLRGPDAADGGHPTRLLAEAWRLVLAAGAGVAVGLVGVALASPFLVFGHVPQNEGVGFLPPTSPLGPFLVIYGGLVALTAAFLAWRVDPARLGRVHAVAGVGLLAAGGLAAIAWAPVVGLLAPLLAVAWWLVRTDRAGAGTLLLLAGLGLVLSMEVVFAKVAPWPRQPRWNTSLKVAVQGWTLAGVGAGVAATVLLVDGRERLRAMAPPGGTLAALRARAPSAAVVGLVVLVLLASLPFAAFATTQDVVDPIRAGDRATIDALDGHERHRSGELEAIQWLDARPGTPTIATAPGRAYDWTSYPSVFSGLPTVVGWQNHQENYRGEVAVQRRVEAVNAVYSGRWADAASALQRYDVRYVYVGTAERERYGASVATRFANRSGLTRVVDTGAAAVYRVDPGGLATG